MYGDLFDQAIVLAKLDPRKPKQANLRRAVSSAYYAAFHAIVEQACCNLMGKQSRQVGYRRVLARAFVHSTMKQVCVSFGGGTLPPTIRTWLPPTASGTYAIAQPIRNISTTFVELQQKRHTADYDLNENFLRSDVLADIHQARQYIESFCQLPMSDQKKFFLSCLLAWRELANR